MHVLMTTEGTYPYAVGGVSTCCHQLMSGLPDLDWSVLPLLTGAQSRRPRYHPSLNTQILRPIVTWRGRTHIPIGRRDAPGSWLPRALLRGLLAWDSDTAALQGALSWCRRHPGRIGAAFASRRAWSDWHDAIDELVSEEHDHHGRRPVLSRLDCGDLYRTLHWIADVAAVPTPETDVLHVTAAGWAAVPALTHRAIHGTPLLLTEHGVYVREAYLHWSRSEAPTGERFVATRVARGLARAAYAAADLIAPVTVYNSEWERALGVDPDRIRPIVNGVRVPREPPTDPPGDRVVIAVGRIDPLKDIKTLLRVAKEVVTVEPGCRFVHHGPVSPGQEVYARACRQLHTGLGLGDRFVFAGPTSDPMGAVRSADIAVLTSVSEGLPMAVLEAMGNARPVVATAVGGVPEALRGAGLVVPPRATHALAAGIVMLLRDPELGRRLGRRGRERVGRRYSERAFLQEYRSAFSELVGGS